MIRVFDRERRFFAGSVEDNAADPLLAVAERVLPTRSNPSVGDVAALDTRTASSAGLPDSGRTRKTPLRAVGQGSSGRPLLYAG